MCVCVCVCVCLELRELVKIHATHNTENEEPLTYDEVLVVKVCCEGVCVCVCCGMSGVCVCVECLGDEGQDGEGCHDSSPVCLHVGCGRSHRYKDNG